MMCVCNSNRCNVNYSDTINGVRGRLLYLSYVQTINYLEINLRKEGKNSRFKNDKLLLKEIGNKEIEKNQNHEWKEQ